MILLYCYDIDERQRVHNYFRARGLLTEAVAPSELEARSFSSDADAILIVGKAPQGLISRIDPELPIFTVGDDQLEASFHFFDLHAPGLLEMLTAFSSAEAYFSCNDVLFGKQDGVFLLGYDLRLTPTERALLTLLACEYQSSVSTDELVSACLGDCYADRGSISAHISQINKKAINIGGRSLIEASANGFYRIKKYI